jgi:hypothetical protein
MFCSEIGCPTAKFNLNTHVQLYFEWEMLKFHSLSFWYCSEFGIFVLPPFPRSSVVYHYNYYCRLLLAVKTPWLSWFWSNGMNNLKWLFQCSKMAPLRNYFIIKKLPWNLTVRFHCSWQIFYLARVQIVSDALLCSFHKYAPQSPLLSSYIVVCNFFDTTLFICR